MMFDTYLVADTERIHVNYIGSNFEKDGPFYIILKDSFNNLKFFALDMNCAEIWMWPNKSWSLMNGITILVYDKTHQNLLFKQTHDFDVHQNQSICVDGKPIRLSTDPYDIGSWWVYYEVVVKDEYDFQNRKVQEGSIVVDIGANLGLFSILSHNHGAKKVYSFEPNPDTYSNLIKNTSECDSIKCINQAISNKTGKLSFYSALSNSSISSVKWIDSEIYYNWGDGIEIDVECITFDSFIKNEKIDIIDYLKIDCEGSEWDIIDNNFVEYINNNVKNLIMEVHPFGMSKKMLSISEYKTFCEKQLFDKLYNFKWSHDFNENELTTFMLKAENIKMKEHTENVDIELSTEVFMALAKQAHKRDITLNEHINEILKKTIKDSEYQFENGTKPQFLTEGPP